MSYLTESGRGVGVGLIGIAVALACAASAVAAEDGGRIKPEELVYRGAFRLPDGAEEFGWGWSGQGMAYRADGEPDGPKDGHTGSIFGTGHNWHQYVSEITIPRPIVANGKSLKGLPTAKTLQKFQNIRGNLYPEMEQARAGLACLPAQGEQRSGKLYFCWSPHLDEGAQNPSHGWCELDLANPRPAGLWGIGSEVNYVTADYMFVIPAAWAKAHTGGMRLATGRFRDGGQGSQGPTLFAFAPWLTGNPPKAGAKLPTVPLLKYSSFSDEQQHRLRDYHHSDDWSGGAWLTSGDRAAVAIIGTKGTGKCWYGFANGVVWPEGGPYPPVPDWPNDQRGWWSTKFEARILLYDPADLAAVAAGKQKPWAPQPYATLEIEKHLFATGAAPRRMQHLGAACFDPKGGYLYVIEPRADEDKSVVHVWQVRSR